MHWHAIRHPTRTNRTKAVQGYDGPQREDETHHVDEEVLHAKAIGPPIQQGQDEACDTIFEAETPISEPQSAPISLAAATYRSNQASDKEKSTGGEEPFLKVSIPLSSSGLTTFAYQRALRNRIRDHKLARGGEYDIHAFTPTFLHDCLMLPGSLANVLGKVISEVR